MTIIGKSLIGLGTIGTIGGVGAYAGGLFENKENETKTTITKTTYKDKLESEGFDLNIDSAGWDKILIEYNKNKDVSKTFKTQKEDIETSEGLKNKCEEFWKKDEINETDYKKLKQWCVKEETIEAVLIRAKYEKLDTNSEVSAVVAKWEAKTEKLKLNKDSFKDIGAKMTNDKSANVTALKAGCKDLNVNTLKTTADDFNQKFENARDWCFLEKDGN